jgi:hypothetical protein
MRPFDTVEAIKEARQLLRRNASAGVAQAAVPAAKRLDGWGFSATLLYGIE